jgi:alpha-galactosidase
MKLIPVIKLFSIAVFCFPALASHSQDNLPVRDTLSKYILTPKESEKPKINGPKVFGVRPGHPILFTIPATGKRPMSFSADNLPKGVSVDGKTGKIFGSVAKAGEYVLTLHVRNKLGEARRSFKIVVGETIALTPPMGWNSWNIYASKVTQELVLANARAMVSSGLVNHGWTYMNIDDVWQGKRGGEFGGILPDSTTFPNMQALVDEIHTIGLKAGIYSTPWVESYGHHIGGSSMNVEGIFAKTTENVPRNKKQLPYAIGQYIFWDKDVKQWVKWGFDYLKYDWNPIEVPETKAMYDLLRNSGRDVVFSLSNSTPFASIPELSKIANAWRTGGDIRDNWKSLKSRLLTQDKWAPYAAPGHWNDPDMMIVGWVGWGKGPYPTHLTADEQYSHMSAWCLQSVPLLLGCDLTKLDAFTLSLLTNDEVLAVNQDPLGKQATLVRKIDSCGVLAKDLEDGSKAVGLFNVTDSVTRKLSVNWSDLGIKGKYIVRDIWRQKDLGTFKDEFSADVPPHGVVMIRIRKAE